MWTAQRLRNAGLIDAHIHNDVITWLNMPTDIPASDKIQAWCTHIPTDIEFSDAYTYVVEKSCSTIATLPCVEVADTYTHTQQFKAIFFPTRYTDMGTYADLDLLSEYLRMEIHRFIQIQSIIPQRTIAIHALLPQISDSHVTFVIQYTFV